MRFETAALCEELEQYSQELTWRACEPTDRCIRDRSSASAYAVLQDRGLGFVSHGVVDGTDNSHQNGAPNGCGESRVESWLLGKEAAILPE